MSVQFIVDKKQLLPLLAAMQPLCTKRTPLDATSYILFSVTQRELILKSTDLEVSLQASCPLEKSSASRPVNVLVSGRRIFDIVRELEGEITCTIDTSTFVVSTPDIVLTLNIRDAADFPAFPERIENLMHISRADLSRLFDTVGFLIPQNHSDPSLNGLYLEVSASGLKATATDGHCLVQYATATYTLPETRAWLLPRRAVFELKKTVEACQDEMIFVGTCGGQLVFSGEQFNFFTKLLAAQFPHYEPILSKEGFVPARIDRHDLVKALKRSACLLSGQFLATTFAFDPQRVHISLHNKEVGSLSEQLNVHEFQGTPLTIRFYAPYMIDGLQSFPQEQVTFYLKNPSRPIIFENESAHERLTYLVMPVSPSQETR